MEEPARAARPILLKDLLRENHWQTYRRFCQEYDKAAARIDKYLVGTFPSDSTYRRWLSGRIVGIPRTEPCAVLEEMFPQYTIDQLFEPPGNDDEVSSAESNVPAPVQHSVPGGVPGGAPAALTAGDAVISEGEVESAMKRKEFLVGLAATAAAPGVLLSSSVPMRVGSTDVVRYRENLAHLYALDDHYGGSSEVYSLTVRSLRHLVRVLDTASYHPAVGDELRSVMGQVMEHAGWLSFDANRSRDARYWWLEALHTARMSDDRDVEVVVLASMSLAASKYGRAREAVDLACSARRVAEDHRLTPRLRSLLAAREALGHAHLGDATATRQSLGQAYADLDETPHDDDPEWLSFWGPADLAAGHASRIGRHLGDLTMAESAAREALEAVGARYPRNRVLYQANLAAVLIARRNMDEAIAAVTEAAQQATQVNSGRLAGMIHTLVRDLHSSHSHLPAVRELAHWTATNLPTATGHQD